MIAKQLTIGYDDYQDEQKASDKLKKVNVELRKITKQLKADIKAGETVLILESKVEQIMGTFTLVSGEEANQVMADEYKSRGEEMSILEVAMETMKETHDMEMERITNDRDEWKSKCKEFRRANWNKAEAMSRVMTKRQLKKIAAIL